MFTSGSTGAPKGAVISHDNLLHFIGWARIQYGFTPDDIHTHLNPLYFDNSVFDIYSTFFTGGTLVPFDFESLQDPAALVRAALTHYEMHSLVFGAVAFDVSADNEGRHSRQSWDLAQNHFWRRRFPQTQAQAAVR